MVAKPISINGCGRIGECSYAVNDAIDCGITYCRELEARSWMPGPASTHCAWCAYCIPRMVDGALLQVVWHSAWRGHSQRCSR